MANFFFLQFSAYVMIEIFYLKKNVSFSRYLDGFMFLVDPQFKTCDYIIDITAN